ncbi:MAG TPA: sugar ABC transporter substrate-binding protein [Gemmatimonadaceae bacterium]
MSGSRTRRRWIGVALVIGLAACNRGGSEGPTVALVVKTLNNPFFVDMERGAREVADSLGFELVVQAPEREIDPERQMQIIENLIQRRVDLLAIVPNGSREIVPVVVEANEAGIPVVVVDTRLDAATLARAGGRIVTFIGSDNVDGGRLAGRHVTERLGGAGRVAIIEGIPGHETGDSRLRGFRESIDAHPGITIVASQTANWERDQAFNVAQNILQAHPDLQAIFAANDIMALGAVEAVGAAGRTGDVLVVGFDAQDDAIAAMREGRMAASIAQHPHEMGRRAMLTAKRVLDGESVPAEQPVAIRLVTRDSVGRAEPEP